MDDKLIIHLNKNFGNIETNKNNEVIYNLKEPVKMNPGDQVTLYKSFLDVRGQSENTITIDQDMEEEILFGFYVPQSTIANASLGDDSQKITTQGRTRMMQQNPTHTQLSYGNSDIDSTAGGNTFTTAELDMNYNIPTNTPTILGKSISYIDSTKANNLWETTNNKTGQMLFMTRTKTIKVPAGNYQVEALANLITLQFNGQTEINNDNSNILFPSNKSFTQPEQNIFDNESSINITDLKTYATVSSTPGNMECNPKNTWGVQFDTTPGVGNLNDWETFENIINNPTTDDGMICVDLSTANRMKTETVDYVEGNLTVPIDDLHANPGSFIYPQFGGSCAVFGRSGTARDEGEYDDGKGGTAEYDNTMFFSKFGVYGYNMTNDEQNYGILTYNEVTEIIQTPNPNKSVNHRVAVADTDAGRSDLIDNHIFGADDTFFYNMDPNNIVDPPTMDENGRIIGAKSFSMDFGDDSVNRFQISNLHEPYRIPTYAQSNLDNKLTTNDSSVVGNQATNYQLKDRITINDGSNDVDVSGCFYPQDASSGLYVISWSNQLRKKTKKYTEALAKREALKEGGSTILENGMEYITYTNYLNTMLHDEAYTSDTQARQDWEITLWARLGFTYDQFGAISQNLESFYSFQNLYRVHYNLGDTEHKQESFKMMGLITHNDANLSMATSLTGLGDSQVPQGQNLRYQTFGSLGTFSSNLNYPAQGVAPGTGATTTEPTILNDVVQSPYENTYLLCSSKYLNAESLPNLTGGKNYFVIESDIILNNYLDVYSNKKAVVGFVSKENSEADTIFSTEGIPFTISNEKILNSIKIRVLNPDGTDTQDDILQKNSAFIFIIERNKKEIINA